MMTSWNETEQIEAHINGSLNTGNALVFEAKLLLYPGLHDKVVWQRNTYEFIRQYGRNQLRQEIEAVHLQLFTRPEHLSFSQKIRFLFTNLK